MAEYKQPQSEKEFSENFSQIKPLMSQTEAYYESSRCLFCYDAPCEISFFSSSPMEDIEAINNSAVPVLNTATNEIAIKIPITSFIFKSSLMQDHFNENYMESEKFPFAIFKGKINDKIDYTKKVCYPVSVTGNMEMHGVEKCIIISGTLTPVEGKISIEGKFKVKLIDYNIKIPTVVLQNIAEEVDVSISSSLEPYVRN